MIPRNLQTATRHALEVVVAAHGDIDQFVARSLDWSVQEMADNGYLSPEQIDAVALMIHAQSNGRGCLEGDQTGLGKGRCLAAMARYNAISGRPTVFLTETPTLFTDFWRDIQDINSAKLFRPLIVNAGVPVYDPKSGATLVPATPRGDFNRALEIGGIPPEFNLVLATYSQFNRSPDASAKARWIAGATQGAQLLLDEAHNAAGDSNTGRNITTAIANAHSVGYSSATSMKGAKNVLIYSALFPETVDVATLPETLQAGGEVLQEVLSGMMARDGVFIRREHDLSALKFSTIDDVGRLARNVELSDKLSEILELMNFLAGDINVMVTERNKEITKFLESIPEDERKGSRMGAISMNFGSRLFAIYRQFQLTIKTELTAERCIAALEAGKKPVVVMENTMESLLRDLVYENREDFNVEGLEDMVPMPADFAAGVDLGAGLTFRDVLQRMLTRLSYYNEVGRYGEVEQHFIESEEGLKMIANIRGMIEEFPDLPASPLDDVRRRVESGGYTMGELSGRSLRIEERADAVTGVINQVAVVRPERPKTQIVREFNDGTTDAILLTRAGSTGISLHASERFDDRRQRVLIEQQSAADVNVRVQFLGRVHRKGQVSVPEIETLSSGLIGEARPIAMQNSKLRKLSANTTANQDSA
ncbi:MAG: strawberry notch C-terminal domain-containing protein, partial [Lysobacter sp.]